MKKLFFWTAALAGAMSLSGCSQFSLVNNEVYNDANLADYHTFRIVTPDEGTLPEGMNAVTYENIASAIAQQLEARGYVQDPNSNILVNIAVTTHREVEQIPVAPVAPLGPVMAPPPPPPGPGPWGFPYHGPYYPHFIYPRYYYGPYWTTPRVITDIYKEGVLTMDLVDLKDRLPLYSASVASIIEQGQSGLSEYRNLQEIQKAVQVLFSKFPVKIPNTSK